LKAIAEGIEEQLSLKHDTKPRRREGTADSGWILIDYIDAVVHIFAASQRRFYQLEQLWREAPVMLKIQ
jgi:ribosome-associated protein